MSCVWLLCSAFFFSCWPECLSPDNTSTGSTFRLRSAMVFHKEPFPLRAATPPLGTIFLHTCNTFIGNSFLFRVVTIASLSSWRHVFDWYRGRMTLVDAYIFTWFSSVSDFILSVMTDCYCYISILLSTNGYVQCMGVRGISSYLASDYRVML